MANGSKSAFLANMSHDIRTPMNAVLGFTTIIEKEADNPAKVRDCAGKIMASGRHLLDLINDVLDISKIESGKMVLTSEPFRLSVLLERAAAVIGPQCEQKGQAFEVVVPDDDEVFVGDAVRLRQLVQRQRNVGHLLGAVASSGANELQIVDEHDPVLPRQRGRQNIRHAPTRSRHQHQLAF